MLYSNGIITFQRKATYFNGEFSQCEYLLLNCSMLGQYHTIVMNKS